MAEGNGVAATLDYVKDEIRKLWDTRASKESVENAEKYIERIEKSVDELKSSFRSLQVSILAGCVLWALGSAGFLIGVLQLAGH